MARKVMTRTVMTMVVGGTRKVDIRLPGRGNSNSAIRWRIDSSGSARCDTCAPLLEACRSAQRVTERGGRAVCQRWGGRSSLLVALLEDCRSAHERLDSQLPNLIPLQ